MIGVNSINLYEEKSQCCACAACFNVCRRDAILFEEDIYGFEYPTVNIDKCIKCYACRKVCSYQGETLFNAPVDTYAAMATNNSLLMESASGGVFASISKNILRDGGVVYGCSMEFLDGRLEPKGIAISQQKELIKLQGSKYVHSNMSNSFDNIKQALEKETTVLFSGTPCQVDALKNFMSHQDITNLYTVDLICHGVPSKALFQSYIEWLNERLKGTVYSFKFRDKSLGDGLIAKIFYVDKKGQIREGLIPNNISSYYYYFLEGETYRENCYTCKYARKERVGDVTIGDFWKVEIEHPEFMVDAGGKLDTRLGVSAILCNTEKGKRLLDKYGTGLILEKSDVEKVAKWNCQLNHPSQNTKKRKAILDAYKTNGYQGVEAVFQQELGLRYYSRLIKSFKLNWKYSRRKQK